MRKVKRNPKSNKILKMMLKRRKFRRKRKQRLMRQLLRRQRWESKERWEEFLGLEGLRSRSRDYCVIN